MTAVPPVDVARANYRSWLEAIDTSMSAYLDMAFDWYEAQPNTPLPPQVGGDPDKLYVTVDSAKAQTDKFEAEGEIEKYTAMGFEAYGIIDVPVSIAVEAMMFHSGKPVGQPEGETHPRNSVFARTKCSIEQKWGENNYLSKVSMMNGGVARDLQDQYTILVRQNDPSSYSFFGSFWQPLSDMNTATQAQVMMLRLSELADGTTEMRHCVRRNGQSYAVLGRENGRATYGFNKKLIRDGELSIIRAMRELKMTGRIEENRH